MERQDVFRERCATYLRVVLAFAPFVPGRRPFRPFFYYILNNL
jgi:hypothetical protein